MLRKTPAAGARWLVAPLLMVGILATAPSASAYVPSYTNESKIPLRWTNSNCIMLRINSTGSDDVDDGSDVAAVRSAVARWHEAVGSCSYLKFNILPDSPTATANFDRKGDNENTVNWVEKGWKTEREHDPAAAGLTTVFFVDDPESSRDGKILDADIELNGEFFSFSARAVGVPGKTDVENTVVHELGHVMGLDHPCDDGLRQPIPKDHTGATIPKCSASLPQELLDRTMYNFADLAETKKRSPEADDILAICQTYPLKDNPGSCSAVDTLASSGCAVAPGAGPWPAALLATLCAGLLALLRRKRR